MKRLVLLGEGHGEVSALPILVKRLLKEKEAGGLLFVDPDVIRSPLSFLVKWDKAAQQPDFAHWIARVMLAARRRDIGGVLAVYDGDFPRFPAGSAAPFCAATAAKSMAAAAVSNGAGKMFSLSVVFACSEVPNMVGGRSGVACGPQVGGWPAGPSRQCPMSRRGSRISRQRLARTTLSLLSSGPRPDFTDRVVGFSSRSRQESQVLQAAGACPRSTAGCGSQWFPCFNPRMT